MASPSGGFSSDKLQAYFLTCCDQELQHNKHMLAGKEVCSYQPKSLHPGCFFIALKTSLKKGSIAVPILQMRKLESFAIEQQETEANIKFISFSIQVMAALPSFKLHAILLSHSTKPWLPLCFFPCSEITSLENSVIIF